MTLFSYETEALGRVGYRRVGYRRIAEEFAKERKKKKNAQRASGS